ncbi:MAG: GNAT family N-acetyltransferase [Alphaproteobacteria bacterium]
MSYRVRPAAGNDRPVLIRFMAALQDVEHALHPDRPAGAGSSEAHLDYLIAECAANDSQVVLAVGADGTPVGFAIWMVEDFGGHYVLPEHRNVGWVSDIWIEPAHRGRNILDLFLTAAEDHFRALGISRLMLAYLRGNEGARLAYERRGFTAYETILERDIPASGDPP